MNNLKLAAIIASLSAFIGASTATAFNQIATPGSDRPIAAPSPELCKRLEDVASTWSHPFTAMQAERIHERLGCDPLALAQRVRG